MYNDLFPAAFACAAFSAVWEEKGSTAAVKECPTPASLPFLRYSQNRQ